VGVQEDIGTYLYRHTLGRPRDIIHLGTVLLEKRPEEGFDSDSIREAVAEAEVGIAEQYLAEVRPLLDQRFSIKNLISNHVSSNVMTAEALAASQEAYIDGCDGLIERDAASDMTVPFATLFELGLLGVAGPRTGRNDIVQSFRAPSRGLGHPDARKLPDSKLYFLHPILNYLLRPGRISERMIVGHHLPSTNGSE
jgi:hypothetical protein